MSEKIYAPFTPEQVKALNEYQIGGWFHPFTCADCRDRLGVFEEDGTLDDRSLIATEAGWVCETCDYTQDWAWEGMTMGPPEYFQNLRRDP